MNGKQVSTHSDGTNPKRARVRVGSTNAPSRANDQGETSDHAFDRSKGKTRARALGQENGRDHLRPDTRGVVPEAETLFLAEGFGAYLRSERRRNQLTQERLSDLCGLTNFHISRLERGLRRPSVPAVKALTRILAPAGEVEGLEQHLAGLAGKSLREGANRRKLEATNRNRRQSLKNLEKLVADTRARIRKLEVVGRPVNPVLRSLFERTEQMAVKLRSDIANQSDSETIAGFEFQASPPFAPKLPYRPTFAQLEQDE